MARNRSLRTSITKLLLLAAVLSVICMIPSFAQPPQVSAQTCPYGETSYYYPGTGYTCTGGTTTSGINCGTYVSYNGTCNGVNSQYQVNCGSYVSYTGSCTNSCGGLVSGCACAYGTSVCNNCSIVGAVGCNSACGAYPYASTYGSACGACGGAYPYASTYGSACGACGGAYPYSGTYGGACGATCPYGGIYPTCTNSTVCPYGGIYPTCSNTASTVCPYPSTYTAAGCTGSTCAGNYSIGINTGCNPNVYNSYNGVGGSCVGMALQPGQTCTNGVVSNAGAAGAGGCVLFSQTTGQCTQYAAATTAAATTGGCVLFSQTTGQCTQYAAATTGSGCAMFSTTTGQCTEPIAGATAGANCSNGSFATAAGCSASTVSSQVTCPGTGASVTISGSETAATACPVVCYTTGASLPQYEPPGSQCPAGTSSTPSSGSTSTTPGTSSTTTTTTPPGTTSSYTTSSVGSGFSISVQAGWDLVGGPAGTTPTQTDGSVYTWKAGDSAYEQASGTTPFTAGEGAWVHFAAPATISLPTTGSGNAAVQLPPGQFVMIGNGGDTPATVTGADHVFTYDATAGYTQTNTLAPGQGAWAESDNGGTATITWGASTGAAS